MSETIAVRYPEYKAILEECMRILDDKGEDYTEGNRDKDRLYNFRTQAVDAGLSMEQVWLVFFGKHVSAIKAYCKRGQVESEPIRERIKDAINYLLLLSLMVAEREAKP